MAFSRIDQVRISGVATAIPPVKVLSSENPAEENRNKNERWQNGQLLLYRASEQQTTSDLGFAALKRILEYKGVLPEDLGFIIFISKTPDYRSPATAAVLHGRILPGQDCIAYDLNIGNLGFLTGLQAGASLLGSINKNYGVIVTGDTPGKFIFGENNNPDTYSDGASAILLEKDPTAPPLLIQTYSRGNEYQTMLMKGGFRTDMVDRDKTGDRIFLNEELLEENALENISSSLKDFYIKTGQNKENYELFALHPSRKIFMEELIRRTGISGTKIHDIFIKYGDMGGASIPLVLSEMKRKTSNKEIHLLACSYGEGISWGFADLSIRSADILDILETVDHFTEGMVEHDF